jgi:hypothetical protein
MVHWDRAPVAVARTWLVGGEHITLARNPNMSDSQSFRICCQCNHHMNPAHNPVACSICRYHHKCAKCFVYPAARQRTTPDQHRGVQRIPLGNGFVSLHENDSDRITVSIASDDVSLLSEHGEWSPCSTKPGCQRPAAQPNMSGWW